MSTGEFESLSEDWLAAEMCRFDLQVSEAPARGVVISHVDRGEHESSRATLTQKEVLTGVNLATLPLLQSLEPVQQLYSDICTKNLYRFTVWRRLKPEPPQEPELAPAHDKLIETWLAYAAGYEKLIRRRPKTINLRLRMQENVKQEQLPTGRPEQIPEIVVQPAPVAPSSPTTQTAPAGS